MELEQYRDEFNFRTESVCWFYQSETLKYAADVLLNEIIGYQTEIRRLGLSDTLLFEMHMSPRSLSEGAYMVLIGIALENLLKSIYVLDHPESIDRDEGQLPQDFNHKLRTLAEKVGFITSCDTDEIGEFLDKAEQYVVWAGRYPTPRNYRKLVPKSLGGEGLENLDLEFPADSNRADDVYKKLTALLSERLMSKIARATD